MVRQSCGRSLGRRERILQLEVRINLRELLQSQRTGEGSRIR